MKKIARVFCVSLCFLGLAQFGNCQVSTDGGLSVEQLIKKHGYPFEEYVNVTTEDGYLLDIYRIPHGRKGESNSSRPSVMLVHGLTGSSRNFVAMGPKRGLAFYLADRGYDLWLLNCRGTAVSRKHVKLNPDEREFWLFSWHEIGVYDLPATVDLMKSVTGKERFTYIGHSQGTTVFYVFASERPEYNKYFNVAIFFGPQAYMAHLKHPYIQPIAAMAPFGKQLADILGWEELPPSYIAKPWVAFLQIVCSAEGFLQDLCANIFFVEGGYDEDQLIKSDLPKLVAGFPTIAVQQGIHFAQNIVSGDFKQYSYDPETNMKKYNSLIPPSYNLSKITAPLAFYYSEDDWLGSVEDLKRLCSEVANCSYAYKVPHTNFSHYDFLFAKDIVKLVYIDLLKTLKRYNKDE